MSILYLVIHFVEKNAMERENLATTIFRFMILIQLDIIITLTFIGVAIK